MLNGQKIGTTLLEKGDPPMGVAFGKIDFIEINYPYTYLKNYCAFHDITINMDDIDVGLIDTQIIPELRIVRQDGFEIKGVGNSICGMRGEGYEVSVLGIPHPFYKEEFPHLVKEYLILINNVKDV